MTKVAILGRPNVGKSTLFNALTHSRKSVVKNQAGVTRDILTQTASWWGHDFEVLDTGGITQAKDDFSQLIKKQIQSFVHEFDLLIIVLDAKSGLMSEDKDILRFAKTTKLPFLVVINKVDQFHKKDLLLSEFFELGIDFVPTSFEKSIQVDVIVEWIIKNKKNDVLKNSDEKPLRLCLIGKPNVGKSSLCNYLLGKARVLVSKTAGTTIDSVEDEFIYEDKKYQIVDTAGLRKNTNKKRIEELSVIKAKKNVEKSDIVLFLIDAQEAPTKQDALILEFILKKQVTPIVVANKSDEAEKSTPQFKKQFFEKIKQEFRFFPDIAVIFTSAKTGRGIKILFQTITSLWEKSNQKIPTSALNDFFTNVIRKAPSPVYGATNVKFYYVTQTRRTPPSFILFANHPDGVTPSYRRFLIKQIQKKWEWQNIPISISCLKK